jgi:hypothetical protein
MGVHKFEHLHGVVLTKLMRSDRPTTLRMVETAPKESWSQYRVNDAVDLLIKASTSPRTLTRERGHAWTFTFTPREVRLAIGPTAAYAALVCAFREHNQAAKVCLLTPADLALLLEAPGLPVHVPGEAVAIPANQGQQSVTVKSVERKFLRATSRHEAAVLVPQGRLETWVVPGG